MDRRGTPRQGFNLDIAHQFHSPEGLQVRSLVAASSEGHSSLPSACKCIDLRRLAPRTHRTTTAAATDPPPAARGGGALGAAGAAASSSVADRASQRAEASGARAISLTSAQRASTDAAAGARPVCRTDAHTQTTHARGRRWRTAAVEADGRVSCARARVPAFETHMRSGGRSALLRVRSRQHQSGRGRESATGGRASRRANLSRSIDPPVTTTMMMMTMTVMIVLMMRMRISRSILPSPPRQATLLREDRAPAPWEHEAGSF